MEIMKQDDLQPYGELICGDILYKSNPLKPFINDCDRCKYFYTTPLFHPSGKCTYGNICCGYGMSCKNFVMMNMYKEKYGNISNKEWE